MKYVCQLFPHPKVRACLGYVNNCNWAMFQYNHFAKLLNLKFQLYFTTTTTFLTGCKAIV